MKQTESPNRIRTQIPEELRKFDFSIFSSPENFEINLDLSNCNLIECIKAYCKYKVKGAVSPARKYSAVVKHLMAIEKKYNLNLMPPVINDIFWQQFRIYLKEEKNLKSSTINNFASRICTALKWAANYGAKLAPTFDDYSMPEVLEKPIISLTQDEVSRITYFDVDLLNLRDDYKETLKLVRDQFVISCYLGQRWSDLVRMSPECFKGDIFTITQQKTGQKSVVDISKIAMYPDVIKRLLKKYKYRAPYPVELALYNKHLHELFKLAGFTREIVHEYKDRGVIKRVSYKQYELISSHTGRRTMITNAITRGMHQEHVRRASGHKTIKSFERYIRWNDQEVHN